MTNALLKKRPFQQAGDQIVFQGRVLHRTAVDAQEYNRNFPLNQVVGHQRECVVISKNGNVRLDLGNGLLEAGYFLRPF